MSVNFTPSSTVPIPAAVSKNPSSVKSKKEERAEAKSERAAESKEYHKRIKFKAMAQVQVWNWKEKPAAQSSAENSSSKASIRRAVSAVTEVRGREEPLISEFQFPVFQSTPHMPVHILQQGIDQEVASAAATGAALSERYLESPVLIGQGVLGKIMQGYDLVDRSVIAIKKTENNPSAYRAIVHESNILQELGRRGAPHCLHLRAAFDRSLSEGIKEHVMVTDLVPARNMYENHLNPQTRSCLLNYLHILAFGKQLLEYLTALSPDVIHGDLAPTNLIYEMDCCHLTVLDHGLSRKVNDNTAQLIQKSFYRSPEVILKGPIDCSADIWSVGCILFELFTGKALFPVYDHEANLFISSNELLQRIYIQLGMPPQQFLEKCADASSYYYTQKSHVHFHKYLPIGDSPWKDTILAAAPQRGMAPDAAHGFIQLLEGMLRYENRLSAAVLLHSPLFETGIFFHLSPFFISGDSITVYRAWDMHRHLENLMTIPFPSPVFELNNSQVTRTCLHIPLRDPDDQYIVYLSRQGLFYPGQCRSLKKGEMLEFDLPASI
jgi:serine/threonine protein kinase